MADLKLSQTTAAAALTGAELAYVVQGGNSRRTTTQAIADLAGAANLTARLNAFRDAATFYVSKRISASDSNNGTSPGEPFLTIGAAYAAANAYVVANPGVLARIEVGPGVFTEANLPFRSRPNIYAKGASQRGTTIKPAVGQELNGFFALDSGCMVEGFRFSGHQATGTSATDSNVGTRAWAIRFNEQANGGLGPIIYASPYVKDCASITAEDDDGLAGSTSTGDTGGGIEVDGAKCHPNSPVRSMVVYGYTQQNLGGPGVVIKNDAYCELVSFFGLFCTWHVRAETGGWATLSGGGCSEFGLYGVVANGYSPTALYTGSVRVVALAGATQVDVVSLTSNRIGSSNRPHNGQVVILGANTYVVASSVPINSSGVEVADDSPTRAGYRVNIFNPNGSGLVANVPQGTTADFRRISRVSAGAHTALFVGSGTNYNALPLNGGIPVRANQFVEENFGRVYGLSVNDAGDIYAASGAFQIDGTTGSVTINTDQFSLSGLDGIGPLTRGTGVPKGVQAKEFSNNITLLDSTGVSGSDTLPTQFGVRSYVDNRFLTNVTATAGQPLTISDTSTQDGQGFWTRTRNFALSLNGANGLAQLTASALLPLSLLPPAPVRVTVRNVTGATIPVGTPVYITGSSGTTMLVAPADASVEATAANTLGVTEAAIAHNSTGVVVTSGELGGIDTNGLTEGAAVWLSETTGQMTSTRPTQPAHGVLLGFCQKRAAGAAGILFVQVRNGWELEELHDVLITSPTAGQVLRRAADGLWKNATLAAGDISGLAAVATTGAYGDLSGRPSLATVATTGAYSDLSGRPTLGTAAAANIGTAAGNLVALDGSARLPAVDGSQLTGLPAAFNPAIPGPIGSTTPAAGTFTALVATTRLGLPSGAPASPVARDLYQVADTLRYLDSGGVERLLLNGADNLANLGSTATARSNLGLGSAATAAISTSSPQNLAATAAAGSSGQVADAGHVHQFQPTDLVIPLSGESVAITVSTLLTIPYWPRPHVFTAVPVWMINGAPTGAAMQLDIRIGGTSIFSTLPTISAGATNSTTATPAVFSTAFVSGGQTIALGSSVTFHATQIGTGGGTGLKVAIPARRAS